jgi:peptidoglycan/xylan/chitin deacetylase (PgdA/CDA1 family)
MCSDLSPPLPAASYPPNSERSLYLTFNDGPSVGTREVLEVLSMFQSSKDAVDDDPLHATFFLLGNNFDSPQRGQAIVANNLQVMQDILTARHSLGLRSYSGDCADFVDYETAQKNVDQVSS